ncbi:MAG: leucine-rich repeat domain-containing protein, partial [Clostridia bacterium]|nr:leucine-rich repeat domain-containing protein [Clostridia bacterium]
VTSIGNYAFYKCTSLESVTIGSGVTSIGDSAFSGCSWLTEIDYNAVNVADLTTLSRVFGSSGALGDGIDVTFGESVERIPAYLFCESSSYYKPNVKTVTIGSGVTSIGRHAFYGCTKLSEINYYATNVTDLESSSYVFYNAGKEGNGINVTFGNSVERIPAYLFYVYEKNQTGGPYYNSPKIKALLIGDSVTYIGKDAFCGCSGVTNITIPGCVTSIGNYAFYKCTSLESVTIGSGVTSIGGEVFSGCTGLTSITIPDSVTSIGGSTFSGCTGLTDVYYYGTPENWNAITIGSSNTSLTGATRHYYIEVLEQPATCISAGISSYSYWSDTNPVEYVIEPEIIGLTDHTPGDPIIENTISPTCSEDGSYDSVVYCSVCGEELSRESVTVPATEHTPDEPITENTVAPTCTEDGSYDSVVYCSVCGEELSRETVTVPATGHKPGGPNKESVVPTTCTVPGHYDRVIYCTVCGEELNRRTITIQATGHTPAEPVTENYYAPTCTYSGRYDSVVYCSACGEELSRETIMVYATGHNIKAFTVEPTCTNVGYTNYICLTCGNLIGQTTIIPAKGHTPGSPVAENETSATCHSAQHYDNVVYCSACGEELSRTTVTVPGTETEHIFADYHYNYDATETSDGTKTANCVYCNATDTIPAPGTRITDSLKDAKLTVSKSQLVNFGSSATLNATATGVPEDYYLIIYEGNRFVAKGDNKSVSCVVEDITEDRVFTVKIADRYGNTKSAANTQKTVTVKVQTGFIYRLIEFFKKLFSIIPLIKQTS